MASILLQPGETFEHSHNDTSDTVHVSGKVEFVVGSSKHIMRSGERISTPPHIFHAITNVGSEIAQIDCIHHRKL